MESYEVIKQSCEKTSPKEVAANIGVSLSLVYKWSQPNTELGSGSRNPLDRVAALIDSTRDPGIIQWLCARAGGYFVRNPESHCEEGFEVMPATSEIVAQFAALLSEISHAAEDDSITNDESQAIRKVWEALKGYTEGFVSCCEEGDFEKIRRPDKLKF